MSSRHRQCIAWILAVVFFDISLLSCGLYVPRALRLTPIALYLDQFLTLDQAALITALIPGVLVIIRFPISRTRRVAVLVAYLLVAYVALAIYAIFFVMIVFDHWI